MPRSGHPLVDLKVPWHTSSVRLQAHHRLIIFGISLKVGPVIAPNLSLRTHWIKADNQPPQDTPRFVVVLIAILALVNVSATVLMFEDWATMTDSMAELEQSITEHLTETSH
jgi:hypothetical protein